MVQDTTRDCDKKCRYYLLRHPRNVGTTSRGHREAQSLIEQSAQTVVGLALGANSWETSMGRVREQSGGFFFFTQNEETAVRFFGDNFIVYLWWLRFNGGQCVFE